MREPGAGFGESLLTRACAHGAHRECPHLSGMGGGVNPRRLRLEFGAGLCPCTCHSSCPVILTAKRLTVPMKTWHTSCTCPGAQPERQRMAEAGFEVPDFDKLREDVLRRSRARKEAFEATRARAAGKSREEIREIYAAELRIRGMKIPKAAVLDAVADRINGNPLPAARLLGESLAQMGKGLYDISRLFRERQ